jgi:uncharacterized iron-regulated membrane protein
MATSSKPLSTYMRILHRYIGFFLAGIMAVYAISGIVLIFRETDFLKQEKQVVKTVKPGAKIDELGKMIGIRDLKITKTEGDTVYFPQGTYNSITGVASYKSKQLPFVMNQLTQLHKASTKKPLYILNLIFGLSLLFFVVSSFWMFKPKTAIFKKGMYFTIAGIILTLILLFV